jgi:PKD repeat protein
MDTDELVVTVEAAPKAEFVSEDSVAQNIEVHFDASNSDGSGSNIVKYSWDFGDGSKTEYGKTIKHKFAKAGNYFVTLSVLTDSKAECKSATFVKSIYVNMQPVAVAGNDKSGIVNELLSFDASFSVDYDGKIKKYIWDFGDGEKDEGINVFHSYKKKGNYRVILKVVDNTDLSNNSATDSLNVVINNYRE